MIKRLTEQVNEGRARVAPVAQELRPLRQRAEDLETESNEKKAAYESAAARLDSNLQDLERQVKGLRQESESLESRCWQAKCDRELLTAYRSLLDREQSLIVSSGHQEDASIQSRSFM